MLVIIRNLHNIVINFSGVFRQKRVNVRGLFSDSFDTRCVIVRTLYEIVIYFNGVYKKTKD